MEKFCLTVARMRANMEDDAVQPHEYLLLRTPQKKLRRAMSMPGDNEEEEEEEEEAREEEEGEQWTKEDNVLGRGSLADLCVGNREMEEAIFGKMADDNGNYIETHKGYVVSRLQFVLRCTKEDDGSLNWMIRDPFSTFRTCITNDIFDAKRIERKFAYKVTLGTKIVVQGYTMRSMKYVFHFMKEEEAVRLLSRGGTVTVPVPRNKDTIKTSRMSQAEGTLPMNTTQDILPTKREVEDDDDEEQPRLSKQQRRAVLEDEESSDEDVDEGEEGEDGEEPACTQLRRVELEETDNDDDDDDDRAADEASPRTYLLQKSRAPPAHQLQEGEDVECAELTEGYRGSWSRARILKFASTRIRCEVEYYDLLNNNGKNCKEWKDVKSSKVFKTDDTFVGVCTFPLPAHVHVSVLPFRPSIDHQGSV